MRVNIWKQFIGLLPGGSRIVGRVVFINTITGMSTVELRDGSQFAATGTDIPVGTNAIVVDGVITTHAPDLPQYDVEV